MKDLLNLCPNLTIDLELHMTEEDLIKEFQWYLCQKGKVSSYTSHDNIVKYFQQNNFYRAEKIAWQDVDVRNHLIENRCKFLNKTYDQLTNFDILTGFKRSGLYHGYSGFNPLIVKWVYEKYDIKRCYDPFGGWGHRLIGSANLDLYIYNDLSTSTAHQVNLINNFFDIGAHVYIEDALNFIPNEEFDAIVTCPPYYNLETYECGPFESVERYNKTIDYIFDVASIKKCKIIVLIMRDDMLGTHIDYTHAIDLRRSKPHKHVEKLYIWEYGNANDV